MTQGFDKKEVTVAGRGAIPEVYIELERLRLETRELQASLKENQERRDRDRLMMPPPALRSFSADEIGLKKLLHQRKYCLLASCLLLILTFTVMGVLVHVIFRVNSSFEDGLLYKTLKNEALTADSNGNQIMYKYYPDTEYRFRDCKGTLMKQSFPDLDYALLGYNILKGFPLSIGHDPGFTFPIFQADYTNSYQTADCRYSVPKGILLVPDVSCVTSFSSKVIQTQYEFSKSLSISAHAHGGGFGISFSANAGYKEATSTVSKGEWVFILSKASCNYYYSRLEESSPPTFHPMFLDWVYRLNNDQLDENATYLSFFEYYGTHFLTDATFGASFAFEHKMQSEKFESLTEKGVNVALSASYSGTVNVGGGFDLDTNQKESASKFRSEVETKTITKGAAPPANGDALTWASTVKESPVPVQYNLKPIKELFTEQYMGKLNIDFKLIAKKIDKYKGEYCVHLQRQGVVDTCHDLSAGLEMQNTEIHGNSTSKKLDLSSCIDECLQRIHCVAVTYCHGCREDETNYMTCRSFDESEGKFKATENTKFKSLFMLSKMKKQVSFENTKIKGNNRALKTERTNYISDCLGRCIDDVNCVGFSYCNCTNKNENCKLYADDRIWGLDEEHGTKTYFISRKIRTVEDIFPTTTTTTKVTSKISRN